MLKVSFQSKSQPKITARVYRRSGKPRYAGNINYDPAEPFPAEDILLGIRGGRVKKNPNRSKLFFITLLGGKHKAKK